MNTPLPITEDQRRKDEEHIKLLSVFHFVLGGLALCGIAFVCMHYFLFTSIFANPEMWKHAKGAEGSPDAFFENFAHILVWFYLFMGVLLAVACILNILSGVFLRQRKHRMFSLVVAGLNCLQIPFGTALGVLTILVLLRDSVRQSYVA